MTHGMASSVLSVIGRKKSVAPHDSKCFTMPHIRKKAKINTPLKLIRLHDHGRER